MTDSPKYTNAQILGLLAQFNQKENNVSVSKIYLKLMGNHFPAALMLDQLVFWTPKARIPGGWIAKTYKEWEEKIHITEKQARLGAKKLKEMGLIETKVKKFAGKPTVHYKLDLNALIMSLMPKGQFPYAQRSETFLPKGQEPYTELTTELNNNIESTRENFSNPVLEEINTPEHLLKKEKSSGQKEKEITYAQIVSLANDLSDLWGNRRSGRPVIDALKRQIELNPQVIAEIKEHAPRFVAANPGKWKGRLLAYIEEEKYTEAIPEKEERVKSNSKSNGKPYDKYEAGRERSKNLLAWAEKLAGGSAH